MRVLPGWRWRRPIRSAAMVGSIEERTHGPADYPPAAEIEDGNQIQPALAGEDAGGIGDPDLVRTSDSQTWETVRGDQSAVAAMGGGVTIPGALPGKEAFGPHEPGDAIAPSGATEHLRQARTAVSAATAGELLPNAGT